MSSTLHLQHLITTTVTKLHSHLEKPEISFKGWPQYRARSAYDHACWVGPIKASPNDVYIDLSNAQLSSQDGETLAALEQIPKLTSRM